MIEPYLFDFKLNYILITPRWGFAPVTSFDTGRCPALMIVALSGRFCNCASVIILFYILIINNFIFV
jgi:hypothetical protein